MTFDPAAGATETPGEAPAIDAPQGRAEGSTGTPEVDEFAPLEGGEPDTFDRTYVTKLREGGAKYRTELREAQKRLAEMEPLAGAFSGWEPEQAEGWKTFLTQAQQDPDGAIAALVKDGFGYDRESATALIESLFPEGEAPAGDPETPTGDDKVSRAEVERILAERDQERELDRMVSSLQGEAKELGYDPAATVGTPDEYRYQRLLHLAAHTTDNDLKKAHEALVAEEQTIVQRHLDQMSKEADGHPAPSGGGVPGVPVDGQATDMNKAAERAAEFLAARH